MDIKLPKNFGNAKLIINSYEKEVLKINLLEKISNLQKLEKQTKDFYERFTYIQKICICTEILHNKKLDTSFKNEDPIIITLSQATYLSKEGFLSNDIYTKLDKFFLSKRKS